MNQDFIKSDHTIQSNSDFLDESSKYRYLSTSQSICFISLKISAQNDLDPSKRSSAWVISFGRPFLCFSPAAGRRINSMLWDQRSGPPPAPKYFSSAVSSPLSTNAWKFGCCFSRRLTVGTWQKPSICNVWYCALYSCSFTWVLLKVFEFEGAH